MLAEQVVAPVVDDDSVGQRGAQAGADELVEGEALRLLPAQPGIDLAEMDDGSGGQFRWRALQPQRLEGGQGESRCGPPGLAPGEQGGDSGEFVADPRDARGHAELVHRDGGAQQYRRGQRVLDRPFDGMPPQAVPGGPEVDGAQQGQRAGGRILCLFEDFRLVEAAVAFGQRVEDRQIVARDQPSLPFSGPAP
ncbi:hypothetical protein [Nocardia sp. NPDC004722]